MKFAGGGLGNIAYHAASGINEKGYLKKVLAPAYNNSEIDSKLIKTFPFGTVTDQIHSRIRNHYIKDTIFDTWASHYIEDCDIFYGWAHHSLYSIKKAKEHGAITFIDRGSVEIITQNNILKNEYAKHGLTVAPIDKRIIERSLQEYDEVDYIAVPSTFVYDSFVDSGYSEDKLFLNPLGVDTERFTPSKNNDGIFRVIFMGLISIQKGIPYLLRAWNELDLENAELLLVGHERPDIKEILNKELKLNKHKNIILRGNTSKPEEEFRKSTVFVLPSTQDGFGSVVVEAMACGLPVIVTENTGAKDCVCESANGFVIPVGDVEVFKEKILWCYENVETCHRMGENARTNIAEYTWENYQKRLVEKFEEIVP